MAEGYWWVLQALLKRKWLKLSLVNGENPNQGWASWFWLWGLWQSDGHQVGSICTLCLQQFSRLSSYSAIVGLEIGVTCPQCQKVVVERKTKRNRIILWLWSLSWLWHLWTSSFVGRNFVQKCGHHLVEKRSTWWRQAGGLRQWRLSRRKSEIIISNLLHNLYYVKDFIKVGTDKFAEFLKIASQLNKMGIVPLLMGS